MARLPQKLLIFVPELLLNLKVGCALSILDSQLLFQKLNIELLLLNLLRHHVLCLLHYESLVLLIQLFLCLLLLLDHFHLINCQLELTVKFLLKFEVYLER